MITRIEALNFRCLRRVSQRIGPFQVLVGPNASGKTTFLDVVGLLGQLVSDGLDVALNERTSNFQDLVWGRAGERFELAIEAMIPGEIHKLLKDVRSDTVRYEVALGVLPGSGEASILAEQVVLGSPRPANRKPRPDRLLTTVRDGLPWILKREANGDVIYFAETRQVAAKERKTTFKLGRHRSALGSLPADPSSFPVATWLKELLIGGVQSVALDSRQLRKASPPYRGRGFKPDGSNLPWVIADLKAKAPEQFDRWIEHLRTAVPDIEGIRTEERPDDRHRYLMVRYRGGLEVPSWVVSDGTLRLLALTLAAYVPDFRGVYLIEEPENGIHPRAVETVYQSLSSAYDASVLLATHSPMILSIVKPEEVLCFARTDDGATEIVLGSEHPALREWHGEINLATLFAGGVLG